jgi:hypothetical protein
MVEIARDPKLPVPPGLDDGEQRAAMLKAYRQRGGVHGGEELTVVPRGTPPLGGAWRAIGTVSAPGSGKPYTIYLKSPHKSGPGTKGTRTNHPVSDAGTTPLVEHRPPAPTGAAADDVHQPAKKNPTAEAWLGAAESNELAEPTEELKKVLANPSATEQQIGDKVQKGLASARRLALLGAQNDAQNAAFFEQVSKAVARVGEMRNAAFDAVIQQEERSPGSVSDEKFKEQLQNVLSAERQRQLLGSSSDSDSDRAPSRAMELTGKAIGIVADRKADAMRNLLDQDKRSHGSVTEEQFRKAIQGLLASVRESELLGISRPKTENALDTVGQVLRVMIQRKTEARLKLLQQNDMSGELQKVTDDLNRLKEEAQRLGVVIP